MSARGLLALITLGVLALITTRSAVTAQQINIGVATTYKVLDENVTDGDVVSFSPENAGLTLSKEAYDKRLFGVVALEAPIVYRNVEGGYPIARDGVANVNVTTVNGALEPGDYLTSSNIPGKAQKATNFQGHILGVAMGSFKEGEGEKISTAEGEVWSGQVKVVLAVGPVSPGLFLLRSSGGAVGALDQVGKAIMQSLDQPGSGFEFVRYIAAALVVIVAMTVSFRSFGRNITQGMEALGRNPLARRQIELMILFNILLIAVSGIVSVLFSLALIKL
jgi:F0F1-type ATP synthase membrane subunit c/vacuolar-type H+-ATPase subunit K